MQYTYIYTRNKNNNYQEWEDVPFTRRWKDMMVKVTMFWEKLKDRKSEGLVIDREVRSLTVGNCGGYLLFFMVRMIGLF